MSNNFQNNEKIIKKNDIIFDNLMKFLMKDSKTQNKFFEKYLNIVLSILHRYVKNCNEEEVKKFYSIEENYNKTFNINFKIIEKEIGEIVLKEEKEDQLYDIEELINLGIFSNLFDLSQEFSINLYCFDNGQKINKEPILNDLKKRLTNKNFMKDDLYEYIFNNKNCMNDFENFLKNIINGKINQIYKIFKYFEEENQSNKVKNFLKYLKKIQKKSDIYKQNDINFKEEVNKIKNEKNIDMLYKLSFIYYRYITNDYFNNKEYIYHYGIVDFVQANIGPQNVWNFLPGIKIFENIVKLDFSHNFFGKLGFYELSKILYYNRNIKIINLSFNEIDKNCLKYLVLGMEFFNNNIEYEIEEFDLFNNNIDEDSVKYINYLMNSFKKLKIINLNHNRLGKGLKSFFLNLKILYKKNKNYNLEQLFLSENQADIYSILELANCIKLKYFKLKILVINNWNLNNFAGVKFLKNLKYNKQLEELYIYKSGINLSFINSISNIIKYTNINILSLYKSNLSIMEMVIKIYGKIQLIKVDEKNKSLIPILFNLDLSNSNIFYLSMEDLNAIKNIISHTNNIITDYYDIFKDIENEYNNINNENMRKELENEIKKCESKKKELEKEKDSQEYKDLINKLNQLYSKLKDINQKENLYKQIKEINGLMSNNLMKN